MGLTGAIQGGVRQAAEWSLARDYPTIHRTVEAVFRDPVALPTPLLDMAGLEIARMLAERFEARPMRVRRLIEAAADAGGVPYAVVGDSHSTHLVRRGWKDGRWLYPMHRLCTGASARGLINPDAAAKAGARVRSFLELVSTRPLPVLFKFGQVDIEFVFTFKRLSEGSDFFDPAAFDAFADETVARYVGFLAEAAPANLKPLARVCGIFPPALSDAAWRRGYVNAHIADLHGGAARDLPERLAMLEIPTLAQRTALHRAFNARLFAAARQAGFKVLDGFDALLGPGGVVEPAMLGRAGGANHHLGYAASRAPIVETLWSAL